MKQIKYLSDKHMKHLFFITTIFCYSFFSTSLPSCSDDGNNSNPDTPITDQQLSDTELLDIVQSQTFKYFWDFAHASSGMALERSEPNAYGGEGPNIVTSGGSGFGVMAIIVGTERNYITREQASSDY